MAVVRVASVALFAFLSAASAARFNVVGFPADGQEFAVKLGGNVIRLSVGDDGTVWSGDADANDEDKYSYVITDRSGNIVTEEPFQRSFDGSWKSITPNEVFNRTKSQGQIPSLPQVYDAWPYGYVDALFNASYVPTIHIIMPGVSHDDIYVAAAAKATVDIVFVAQRQIFTKKDATFKVSGNTSRKFRKQQLSLALKKTDKIEGRKHLKFRAGAGDPSFLRERIYTDLVNSLGLPAQQGTHVRMYVNKKFFGLYFMIDDLDKSWVTEVVTGGEAPHTLLFGGDFVYRGPGPENYSQRPRYKIKYRGANPPDNPMADCISLIKQLDSFNPKTASENELNALQTAIEFDFLYRHAALEFLAFHWDGSWHAASNFFLTKTNDDKWFLTPADFDFTLGTLMSQVKGGINAKYEEWAVDEGKQRPLFHKTLSHPIFKAKFEGILKEIVQKVFHPAALAPRLEAIHDFIREDVADDRNRELFDPPAKGAGVVDHEWTIKHFDVLYREGARSHGLPCSHWDCKHGILSFTKAHAEIVAKQLNFTYEDTYVAPEPSKVYGANKQHESVPIMPEFVDANLSPDNSSTGRLAPSAATACLAASVAAAFVRG